MLAIDDLHWLDAPRPARSSSRFGDSATSRSPCSPRTGSPTPGSGSFPGLRRSCATGRGQAHEPRGDRAAASAPRRPGPSAALLRRIHETSDGNLLFALEIARALQQGHLELTSDEPLPIPADLEALLRDRVTRLPDATRSALLICSAASRPTVELVRDASGSSDDPLGPAVEAGIAAVDRDRVAFSHPLLALAVYRSASTSERRAAHRRLAEVSQDLEERAHHLALAAVEPNRSLAELLDRAAGRAFDRELRGRRPSWPISRGTSRMGPTSPISQLRRGMAAAEFRFEAGDAAGARALAQELRSAASPARCGARSPTSSPASRGTTSTRSEGFLESAIAETSEEAAGRHPRRPRVCRDPRWRSADRLGTRAARDRARRTRRCPGVADGRPLSTASAEFMLGLDTAALLSRAATVEGRIVGRRPLLVPAYVRGTRSARS